MVNRNSVLLFSTFLIVIHTIRSCDNNEILSAGLVSDKIKLNTPQTRIQEPDIGYQISLESSNLEGNEMCYLKWASFEENRIELWLELWYDDNGIIDKDKFYLIANVVDEDSTLSSDSVYSIIKKFESKYLYPNFSVTKLHDNFWSYNWVDRK